jgi:hypothetical protein
MNAPWNARMADSLASHDPEAMTIVTMVSRNTGCSPPILGLYFYQDHGKMTVSGIEDEGTLEDLLILEEVCQMEVPRTMIERFWGGVKKFARLFGLFPLQKAPSLRTSGYVCFMQRVPGDSR